MATEKQLENSELYMGLKLIFARLPVERAKNLAKRRRKFSTCVSVYPFGEDLRALAFTLVEIKFTRKSTQVIHRLATQHKST